MLLLLNTYCLEQKCLHEACFIDIACIYFLFLFTFCKKVMVGPPQALQFLSFPNLLIFLSLNTPKPPTHICPYRPPNLPLPAFLVDWLDWTTAARYGNEPAAQDTQVLSDPNTYTFTHAHKMCHMCWLIGSLKAANKQILWLKTSLWGCVGVCRWRFARFSATLRDSSTRD